MKDFWGKFTAFFNPKRTQEMYNAELLCQYNMEQLDQNERLALLDAEMSERLSKLEADDDSDIIKLAIMAIAVVVVVINIKG